MSQLRRFASYHLVMLDLMQYLNCDHLHATQAKSADTNDWKSFVIRDYEVIFAEGNPLLSLEHYQQ